MGLLNNIKEEIEKKNKQQNNLLEKNTIFVNDPNTPDDPSPNTLENFSLYAPDDPSPNTLENFSLYTPDDPSPNTLEDSSLYAPDDPSPNTLEDSSLYAPDDPSPNTLEDSSLYAPDDPSPNTLEDSSLYAPDDPNDPSPNTINNNTNTKNFDIIKAIQSFNANYEKKQYIQIKINEKHKVSLQLLKPILKVSMNTFINYLIDDFFKNHQEVVNHNLKIVNDNLKYLDKS